MLRVSLIIALILAANRADAADPLAAPICQQAGAKATEPPRRERCSSEPQGGAPQGYMLLPTPDPLGDITDARNPSHSPLIAQYAIYASIGNRDGMQILSDPTAQIRCHARRVRGLCRSCEAAHGIAAQAGPDSFEDRTGMEIEPITLAIEVLQSSCTDNSAWCRTALSVSCQSITVGEVQTLRP